MNYCYRAVERIAYSKNKNIFLSFLSAIRYPLSAKRGFTLPEVLVSVAILAFSICGILVTYINMLLFSDLNRGLTLATNALQAKAEEIKRTSFNGLAALNGTAFDINGFAPGNAKGAVEVTSTAYPDLMRIRVVACFKSRGRLVGEDVNLNGILNGAEDANNNGRIDSSAELIALIAR